MAKEQTPDEKAKRRVDDMVDRRKASKQWLEDNFWGEWREAYQQYKCRVEPIIDPRTKKEDKTRTNIALPDAWIITRRKSSRLSSQAPLLRVRAEDDAVSDWLSGYLMFQWDRGGEQQLQRRHVLQGNIFGLGLKRHFWDTIQIERPFRRRPQAMLDKFGVMENGEQDGGGFRLANQEEFDGGKTTPFKSLNEDDQGGALAGLGPEVEVREKKTRFEGPVSSFVFLGDWYPEPELQTIHKSAWHLLDDFKDDTWLQYFGKRKFLDPRDGKEKPVLIKKQVEELIALGSFKKERTGSETDDTLMQELRDAIYKTRPDFETRLLPGVRYKITEEHTFREGWPWIAFYGNDKVFLGEMPYPWDLQGKYALSGFAPIQDLLWAIGDTSPRVMRFLFRLHNVFWGQRTDLMTNHLKPLYFVKKTANVPSEIVDRGLYRVAFVDNPNDWVGEERRPGIPPEAFTSEQALLALMNMAEPDLMSGGGDNPAIPQSERRATLGLIQERARQGLAADTIESLNLSLKEESDIKISMLQQTMRDKLEIPERFFERVLTLKEGKTIQRELGPLDIQQDYEVFPVQGSTLALDDEIRKADAEKIYALASADPATWNKKKAAQIVAETFPGQNPKELINQEPPRPQLPEAKMNISLSLKYEDLDENLKTQLLAKVGIDVSKGQATREFLEGVKKTAEAAKAAQEMTEEPPVEGAPNA